MRPPTRSRAGHAVQWNAGLVFVFTKKRRTGLVGGCLDLRMQYCALVLRQLSQCVYTVHPTQHHTAPTQNSYICVLNLRTPTRIMKVVYEGMAWHCTARTSRSTTWKLGATLISQPVVFSCASPRCLKLDIRFGSAAATDARQRAYAAMLSHPGTARVNRPVQSEADNGPSAVANDAVNVKSNVTMLKTFYDLAGPVQIIRF